MNESKVKGLKWNLKKLRELVLHFSFLKKKKIYIYIYILLFTLYCNGIKRDSIYLKLDNKFSQIKW